MSLAKVRYKDIPDLRFGPSTQPRKAHKDIYVVAKDGQTSAGAVVAQFHPDGPCRQPKCNDGGE